MRDIPVVKTANPEFVVDEVQRRRRLFRPDEWIVVWREAADSTRRYRSVVRDRARYGSVSNNEVAFSFSVTWRPDRRRPLLQPVNGGMSGEQTRNRQHPALSSY